MKKQENGITIGEDRWHLKCIGNHWIEIAQRVHIINTVLIKIYEDMNKFHLHKFAHWLPQTI